MQSNLKPIAITASKEYNLIIETQGKNEVVPMKIKQILAIILIILLVLPTSAAASSSIGIVIDGKTLSLDIEPIIINDRTMVTLRGVFEELGATVDWDIETHQAIIKSDDVEVLVTPDTDNVLVNGRLYILDSPATIVNDRLLIPVRFIAEALGHEVGWDPVNRVVLITSHKTTTEHGFIGTYGYNVKNAGAKGNGTTDDTAAIQKALDTYDQVYIPDGKYLINVDKSLVLNNNQILTLSDNAILKAKPTSSKKYSVILISGKKNVTVNGGNIEGERYTHLGTSGEWGMGINIINGSSNVSVSNIKISDCWGDGVYLGGASTVVNITIDRVVSDNNRRQGMSITNARNVVVSSSTFSRTNGTAPQAGIDIEPNPGSIAEDIVLDNVVCNDNATIGIFLYGKSGTIRRITVKNSVVRNNRKAGFQFDTAKDTYVYDSISYANRYGIICSSLTGDSVFERVSFTNNITAAVYGGCINQRN